MIKQIIQVALLIFDDWGIAQSLFDEISVEWGHFDIDLFACDYNAKVE